MIYETKPIFFSSDWHVGHEKAIEYDKRPFKDLNHMHEVLVKRYNAVVPENGLCYFIGDMGNKTEVLRKIMARLNGTKVLIWGNHDKGITTMYNCGFDVVVYSVTLYMHKHRFTLSHCPLRDVIREDTSKMRGADPDNLEPWHGAFRPKHQMCTITDEGQFHGHGHIHSRKDKIVSQKILDKQFDMGVTANNYTPVSWSQWESFIANYLKDRDE